MTMGATVEQTTAISRATIIDVGSLEGPTTLSVWCREQSGSTDGPGVSRREVHLHAALDADRTLAEVTLTGVDPSVTGEVQALVGHKVASGFRRSLDGLRGSAESRLVRRVLWDFPITVMVSGAALILDHPATPQRPSMVGGMSAAGADQCSGWRTGGEMLTKIADTDGQLRMALGPATLDPAHASTIVDAFADDVPVLAPLSFRRARALRRTSDGQVTAQYRDSYADPDGIERALHEWTLHGVLDPDTGRFSEISAAPGQLPWGECPFAGGSATRLQGTDPAAVESLVNHEFGGITTCTHLNDTLRSLAELPDLT